MYLSLRHLSNCLRLLRLSSHPCLILCCPWPLLQPLNPPKTFLWCPSCPLPLLLLWNLSRPWLPVQLSYLVACPGKPPAWLCLPTAGPQIVVARSWMGEWCGRGGGHIAATQITMAFSGLTFPPTSPFQLSSSLKRSRSTTVLETPSGSPGTASTMADIRSSGECLISYPPARAVVNTNAAVNDGRGGKALLARTRSGIWQGPGVGRPTQGCPDRGGGQAGDMGAGDRAGAGRTNLSALRRGAVGRDWRHTGARRWCHGG